MSTHEEYKDDPVALEKSMKARYELRDGDYVKVGKAINGFFIFTAVCFVLSFFAMLGIHQFLTQIDRPMTSTPLNPPQQLPTKAPLQNNITAWRDMVELRERERVATQTYGKVDEAKGTVRIPVDRAMEKLAEKGVAGVTGEAKAPAPAATVPAATGGAR